MCVLYQPLYIIKKGLRAPHFWGFFPTKNALFSNMGKIRLYFSTKKIVNGGDISQNTKKGAPQGTFSTFFTELARDTQIDLDFGGHL